MRQTLAAALALSALTLGGCLTTAPERSESRRGNPPPTAGDELVKLDVYLVERPSGDACLNGEAWELADESTLPEDCRRSLADNGFRVGRIGGGLPEGLRRMTESERSCVNPRRLLMHAAKPEAVALGPPAAHCEFALHEDGRSTAVALDRAQCLLQAAPRATADGRVALLLTPQVRHGDPIMRPRSLKGPDGLLRWDLRVQNEVESYRNLSWEMMLGSDEYVVVGALPERPDTLGFAAFLQSDDGPPKQRLLVLRAGRAAGEATLAAARAAAGPADERGCQPPGRASGF
jgi:hypothetical protein